MYYIRHIGLRSIKPIHVFKRTASQAVEKKKPSDLKSLVKQYGWSALGVYLGLSCVDLPLCFIAVHSLGEETIKVYLNRVKRLVNLGKDEEELIEEIREKQERDEQLKKSGDQNADLSLWTKLKESSLLTEFLIAYGIHKSLIFIRLPITAAITPSVVKFLGRFGFTTKKLNNSFKTMAERGKIRNKSGSPDDYIKNGSIPKNSSSKGKKWFDGLM